MSYATFNPHAYMQSIDHYLYERYLFMRNLKATDPKEYERLKQKHDTPRRTPKRD